MLSTTVKPGGNASVYPGPVRTPLLTGEHPCANPPPFPAARTYSGPLRRSTTVNLLGLHAGRDVVLRHRRALTRRVPGRHRTQDLVGFPVVVLVLENDDHERLLGLGVVERDQLRRRGEALRRLATLHLTVHLVHPVRAHAVERHHTCKRHQSLLVGSGNPTLSRTRRGDGTTRPSRCGPSEPGRATGTCPTSRPRRGR